jgi:mono/diheme cytochrome c family protein
MLLIVFVLAAAFAASCVDSKPKRYVITDSKAYEASLFRQNCSICHGKEADGRTLDDGTKVPSLREGEFKHKTESEIYDQIANGGNGMVPHRNQLSERELRMLTEFVRRDLRGH